VEPTLTPSLHDLFRGTHADLPLWRALATRWGGPVLELGVGAGRVALDLASRGVRVVGVDRDVEALERLREAGAGELLPCVRALPVELRELCLGERFPLIIAPARVLEELEPVDELPTVLAAVAAHLAPGGVLAAQVAEPPPSDQPALSMGVVHRLTERDPWGPGEVLWQERLDRVERCRHVRVSLRGVAGLQPVGALALHWASPATWRARLEAAGLTPGGPGSIPVDALRDHGGPLRTLLACRP